MSKWKKWALVCGTVVLFTVIFAVSRTLCISAWFQGMSSRYCPASRVIPKLHVNMNGIRRGEKSSINFDLSGRFLTKPYEFENSGRIHQFTKSLAIKSRDGSIFPIDLLENDQDGEHFHTFEMPQLDDGEYTFIADAKSSFGDAEVQIPISLYANAIGHIITDRPIYEPGQQIKARVILLNGKSLNPLENRFGSWKLIDPKGRTLAEKERQTQPWGVSAVEFFTSDLAPIGDWTIGFYSGDFSLTETITVEPFTLPRFAVTTAASKTFYRAGDKPTLNGKAIFSSGTPVQDADIKVSWSMDPTDGNWTPPLNWVSEKLIPEKTQTDQNGRFKVSLPEIPDDLVGRPKIRISFKVTDETGESITHSSSLQLSKDPIKVEGLSEFGGLAEGLNNRLFIRVATPDNKPLTNSILNIKRTWDQTDGGIKAETDENGIASIQIDPGGPINVVIPPAPYREPQQKRPVVLIRAMEWGNEINTPVKLSDQLKFEQFEDRLSKCAIYTSIAKNTTISLFISSNGSVKSGESDTPLAICLRNKLMKIRLKPGTARIIDVQYKIQPSSHPKPTLTKWRQESTPWDNQWESMKYLASACLPQNDTRTSQIDLAWYAKSGKSKPNISINNNSGLTNREQGCITKIFRNSNSDDALNSDTMGGLSLKFTPYQSPTSAFKPQATTYLGYELTIEAEEIGASKLRLHAGAIPDIRLRTEPSIAEPGETVSIEILRGPGFSGDIPQNIIMKHPDGTETRLMVDEQSRKTAFKIPENTTGWYQTDFSGAYGRIFVPDNKRLELNLSTNKTQYRPGDEVTLEITVTENDTPVEAAVGLIGVDQSLADLKPLPGPTDHSDSLNSYASSTYEAKELGLGAALLQQGLIQGNNAQRAAMILIDSVPTIADIEAAQDLYGTTPDYSEQIIVESFFVMLELLHYQARIWESNAQPHERFKPETVLSLWEKGLKACKETGKSCTDTYGRDLGLKMLPNHLLNMTEPKLLVVDGSRLPEDMVNWSNWVRENVQ